MAKKKPRTKREGIEYLCGHERYHTMNSWNQSTSFSRCVKVHHLEYPDKQTKETAWDMLSVDHFHSRSGFNEPLDEWERSHGHVWQWGMNGRSGGYVVMYRGYTERSEHKSYCEACGQQNFKLADPEPGKCGRCGAEERYNYDEPPIVVKTWPGRDVYQDEVANRFEDYDRDGVLEVVDLVWGFDQAVDRAVANFIEYCRTHRVEDQEIMVPTEIKVAVEREE